MTYSFRAITQLSAGSFHVCLILLLAYQDIWHCFLHVQDLSSDDLHFTLSIHLSVKFTGRHDANKEKAKFDPKKTIQRHTEGLDKYKGNY